MQNWEQLVRTALVGTERSQFTPADENELRTLGIDLDASQEEIVLAASAIYTQLKKIQFPLEEAQQTLPQTALEERLSIGNIASIQHLRMLLIGIYEDALPEYFLALSKASKRIPEELLPDVLELCTDKPELWDVLHTIIGERGYWLIQQNKAWQYLSPPTDLSLWETGHSDERLALLQHLRRKTPSQAVELLNATWATETLDTKKKFLKTMALGHSEADEDFLESCLDERRREIRQLAARQLAKRAESKLNHRMLDRVQQLITIKHPKTPREKLDVTLPERCDEAMVRDGIDPRSQWPQGGVKASRLGQMMAIIAPKHWNAFFAKNAVEVLRIFARSNWGEVLVQGCVEAAALHQDEEWIDALWNFRLDTLDRQRWQYLNIQPMMTIPNASLFNQLAIKGLQQETDLLEENNPIILLLKENRHFWEDRLTLLVMENLSRWLSRETSRYWKGWHYRGILKKGAYMINPKLYELLSVNWPQESHIWSSWEKDIEDFLSILHFRKKMLEELAVDSDQ